MKAEQQVLELSLSELLWFFGKSRDKAEEMLLVTRVNNKTDEILPLCQLNSSVEVVLLTSWNNTPEQNRRNFN